MQQKTIKVGSYDPICIPQCTAPFVPHCQLSESQVLKLVLERCCMYLKAIYGDVACMSHATTRIVLNHNVLHNIKKILTEAEGNMYWYFPNKRHIARTKNPNEPLAMLGRGPGGPRGINPKMWWQIHHDGISLLYRWCKGFNMLQLLKCNIVQDVTN